MSHDAAPRLHGPSPSGGKARRGGVKHPLGLQMREALSGCSLSILTGRSVFLGQKGKQPSRNHHLSAPLSSAAAKGKKKGSCQGVSALRTA